MIAERDKVFLGNTIKSCRKVAGLTQADLSRRLTLHPSIVGLWEDETRPVPHDRFELLAAALECTETVLLKDARVIKNGYPPGTGYTTLPLEQHRLYVIARRRPQFARPELRRWYDRAYPPPKLPPSEVPLAWCTSEHGTGVYRRHHHGVRSSWAPGPMLVLPDEPSPFGGKAS